MITRRDLLLGAGGAGVLATFGARNPVFAFERVAASADVAAAYAAHFAACGAGVPDHSQLIARSQKDRALLISEGAASADAPFWITCPLCGCRLQVS